VDAADLYLEMIELGRYLSEDECRRCGASSCRGLVERLRSGGGRPSVEVLGSARASLLEAVLEAADGMPHVPMLVNPRPVKPELAEINHPSAGDPVLVTGNNAFTQEVLLTVLSGTPSPFFVLFADTRGDTVDMAVIFSSLTAGRVAKSLEAARTADRAAGSRLVLPGLAAGIRDELASISGLAVDVGPVCAAELPFYFGATWIGCVPSS
jgi:CO dehydrogenase/acetyl-CoA synthase gamma subunit (corrinoid Fe-S protein)